MPEYIDDSNGPDLVGRRIVWRMGQIAWNIVVTGRRESISEAFQRTQLDVEQQKTVQNEIIGLAKRKYAEFPNLRTAIRDFSVLLVGGVPHIKVFPTSKHVRAIHFRKYRFPSLASLKASLRRVQMSRRISFVLCAKG